MVVTNSQNIPYARQSVDEEDIKAVLAVLRSDWLTQGPTIGAFETACAEYCGVPYATAFSNATSALHVACRALGLGTGDWLWTSPNTFVASSNCALYCGARVDFVDIDPNTYNMCPKALAEKCEKAKKENKLPKILIPVHFAGQSCDMKAIKKIADEYDIRVIEDASHAIGGRYCEKPVGSCQYSDLTIFSFHPVKIITTAEGGMIVTPSKEIKQKCDLFRSHGITRDPNLMEQPSEGEWYYEQIDLGYNYRITELQAALGISQLSRVNEFVAKRHQLAKYYDEALSNLPVITPKRLQGYSALHLYPIQVKLSTKHNRKTIFSALRSENIAVNVHYIPVHLQPYYQRMGFKRGDFPQAEAYYEQAISLPLFYDLTFEQQDFVVDTLRQSLAQR